MPDLDANGCPLPPMDHLRSGASATGAMAAAAPEQEFDRKGGNPGPRVTPFGSKVQMPEEPKAGDTITLEEIERALGERPTDEKLSPENEQVRNEALEQLTTVLPDVKEDWLSKGVTARMINDKWDLSRTASWMFDYENLAPKKEIKRKFKGDLSGANDYQTIKTMLKDVKHDSPPPEYLFYSALKLSQKFPQFSMYSLRQILQDFGFSYPAACFAIVEGLEEMMMKEKKSWKDWKRNEFLFIKVQMGDKMMQYPLVVVKGEKTWSKKKARSTPFPTSLTQEVRLVEKALHFYEERYSKLLSKLDAEQIRRHQLESAKALGVAVECPICFDDYLAEEQVICSDGHEYCMFCLHRAVDETLVGQMKLSPEGDIPCLLSECRGIFPLTLLCHVLPGDRLTRLEERIWADFMARAELPNLTTCLSCGYAEQIEADPLVVRIFECKNPKCGRKWCRNCKNLWENHEGKTCKEMSGDPEEMLKKKYDEMMSDVAIRHCQKCNRTIQKVEGCNKVVCQCGAKMCYLCRKPIDGYDHFCKHPLNPGEGCSICSSCKLWEDPDKADNLLRTKLQMQLQEELFELKLAYAGKKTAEAAKEGSKQPPTAGDAKPNEPPPPPPNQGPIAPQQRQFAAIFG